MTPAPSARTSSGTWRRAAPPLAAVGYVAALDVWVDGGAEPRAWLAGVAAVALAWAASRRDQGLERGLGVGAAVVLASLGADAPHAGIEALGAVGALGCALAASMALARIASDGGVVKAVSLSPLPWIAALAVAWWAAIAARLAPPDPLDGGWAGASPRGWMVAASLATGALLFGQAEWTLRRRRLELGVAERATAIRGLLVLALVVAGVVALLGRAQGDGLGRLVVALASALVAAAALAKDAVRVARRARRVVALAIVGGCVVLLGAAASEGRGADAWITSSVIGALLLFIGANAAKLEAPLRPASGAWLDAFARAGAEAGRGDPDDAIRAALLALRAPGGPSAVAPELWTFSPTRVTTVDAAGYARDREGELPGAMLVVAAGEPEATLRTEVLDALEVRRPDLRPLCRWMNDRAMMLATIVAYDGETEAVLCIPRGPRPEPVTLEEVRALKDTADRLAAACRARGTQARMLARAHDAMQRADTADQRVDRLEHERALDVGRDTLAAARLARPATVGVYSAASRMALDALERRTIVAAPIAVVAPTGVDPVSYLARAHLAGARRAAPLVLVDATSAREHDAARWADPQASPLALADRGMLVLLDGAALPLDVQQLVARALAEKRAPWERPDRLDVQLALTGVAPPEELVTQARLDASLASRLGDAAAAPVELPRLRERAEDLRAIVTDRLAREGLRVLGRPVGIDHAAYGRLVEYPFPGEDAELASIVQRLVARCTGDVVRAADVDSLGLTGPSAGLETASGAAGTASRAETLRKDPLSA
jgi:hypothetical protein